MRYILLLGTLLALVSGTLYAQSTSGMFVQLGGGVGPGVGLLGVFAVPVAEELVTAEIMGHGFVSPGIWSSARAGVGIGFGAGFRILGAARRAGVTARHVDLDLGLRLGPTTWSWSGRRGDTYLDGDGFLRLIVRSNQGTRYFFEVGAPAEPWLRAGIVFGR